MASTIRLNVYDRPGVLDLITGVIRRSGVNINAVNAGATSNQKSQINISLRDVHDPQSLVSQIAKSTTVIGVEMCNSDTHVMLETIMLSFKADDFSKYKTDEMRIAWQDESKVIVYLVTDPLTADKLMEKYCELCMECCRSGSMALSKNLEEPKC